MPAVELLKKQEMDLNPLTEGDRMIDLLIIIRHYCDVFLVLDNIVTNSRFDTHLTVFILFITIVRLLFV